MYVIQFLWREFLNGQTILHVISENKRKIISTTYNILPFSRMFFKITCLRSGKRHLCTTTILCTIPRDKPINWKIIGNQPSVFQLSDVRKYFVKCQFQIAVSLFVSYLLKYFVNCQFQIAVSSLLAYQIFCKMSDILLVVRQCLICYIFRAGRPNVLLNILTTVESLLFYLRIHHPI